MFKKGIILRLNPECTIWFYVTDDLSGTPYSHASQYIYIYISHVISETVSCVTEHLIDQPVATFDGA